MTNIVNENIYPCREYKCGKCGGEFNKETILTIKDRREGKGFCPFCGVPERPNGE